MVHIGSTNVKLFCHFFHFSSWPKKIEIFWFALQYHTIVWAQPNFGKLCCKKSPTLLNWSYISYLITANILHSTSTGTTNKYSSRRWQQMAIKTIKRRIRDVKRLHVHLSSIPASVSSCSTKQVRDSHWLSNLHYYFQWAIVFKQGGC